MTQFSFEKIDRDVQIIREGAAENSNGKSNLLLVVGIGALVGVGLWLYWNKNLRWDRVKKSDD